MRLRIQSSRLFLIAWVAIGVGVFRGSDGAEEPWRGLADRIASTSDPDSTAVLVLFDPDVLDSLRSRLPRSLKLVAFGLGVDSNGVALAPAQLGTMYQAASAATRTHPDVWVVGRRSGSGGRRRAARFADQVASTIRIRALRDSVASSRGMVELGRWVDRPGGGARREDMAQGQAYAESVLAVGIPKPTPITRPFDPGELQINPDTLSCYVARLADRSFYSIGGCSEVAITFWIASERLAQLGPGVVPVLVSRIADPNPFVRARIREALLLATQDERILARTDGEYLKLYAQPAESAPGIVGAWWAKFGHYWTRAGSGR